MVSSNKGGTMEKTRWDEYFMKVADVTADMSYCTRLKVGAVAVRDNRIIGTGFNGLPAGGDNCCEDVETGLTKPEVTHAERNLIEFAAKEGLSLKGATMYLTHSPCIECAKSIKNAGIDVVVWGAEYRITNGLSFLHKYGVKTRKF
jgi:dCMP deaminase